MVRTRRGRLSGVVDLFNLPDPEATIRAQRAAARRATAAATAASQQQQQPQQPQQAAPVAPMIAHMIAHMIAPTPAPPPAPPPAPSLPPSLPPVTPSVTQPTQHTQPARSSPRASRSAMRASSTASRAFLTKAKAPAKEAEKREEEQEENEEDEETPPSPRTIRSARKASLNSSQQASPTKEKTPPVQAAREEEQEARESEGDEDGQGIEEEEDEPEERDESGEEQAGGEDGGEDSEDEEDRDREDSDQGSDQGSDQEIDEEDDDKEEEAEVEDEQEQEEGSQSPHATQTEAELTREDADELATFEAAAIHYLATEASAVEDALMVSIETNPAVTSALRQIHSIEDAIATSTEYQITAIQDLDAESNTVLDAVIQANTEARAASLARRQMAEREAAVIAAIAVEVAAAKAKADQEAAEQEEEEEARTAKITQMSQASVAVSSGVSQWQQQIANQRTERSRYLQERADMEAAEREAEDRERRLAGEMARLRQRVEANRALIEEQRAAEEMARLAAETLPADEDLDFDGLEDTDAVAQGPGNHLGGPDVDEQGLEDYEDEEMVAARREPRSASAAIDAARQQATQDEAARSQAASDNLEDDDMTDNQQFGDDQQLDDDMLDDSEHGREFSDEQRRDQDIEDEIFYDSDSQQRRNQEYQDEILNNPAEDEEDLEDALYGELLEDVRVEEQDLSAVEQERASGRSALLHAAEEASETRRAEEAARAQAVEDEVARQQAQQDEVERKQAEKDAAAKAQPAKDEATREKAEQDAKVAKSTKQFDEWMKSDQKRKQAEREEREIEEMLRAADDEDREARRKKRQKEQEEKRGGKNADKEGDKRAGEKRGPEPDSEDDSASKKQKTSENHLKTTTGQNEPEFIDSDSCKAFRDAMDLARFVYDPAAKNSAPPGPAHVGQNMHLDNIFQALASVTEAINKTRVAANRPKVWSLFHPRSLADHDIVGHPVALTRHNALVPILRSEDVEKPHYALVFLLQKGFARRTGGEDFFRMYDYDSNLASAKDFDEGITHDVVREAILKAGWAGRYDTEAQKILGQCQTTEPCEQPADLEWASGIHVVLNGWACAFQLHHNKDALLHKTGFYENAINLINLAIRGLVSSKMIINFFECYEYTKTDNANPLKRTLLSFKDSAKFETYSDLNEYILALLGRLPPRSGGLNHPDSRPPTPVTGSGPGDEDEEHHDDKLYSPALPPFLDRYFDGVETVIRKGSEVSGASKTKFDPQLAFEYDPDHVTVLDDDLIIADDEDDEDDYDENGVRIEPNVDLPQDDGPRFDWRGQLITPESRAKAAADKATKKAEEARAREAGETEQALANYGDTSFADDDGDGDGDGDVGGLFDAEQDVDLDEEDLYDIQAYNAAHPYGSQAGTGQHDEGPQYAPDSEEYHPSAADAAEEAFYSRQTATTSRLPGLALPNVPPPTPYVPTAPSAGFPPVPPPTTQNQQRRRQPPPPQINVDPPSTSPVRHPSVSALRATGESRRTTQSRPRSPRNPPSASASASNSSGGSSRRSSLNLAVAPDTPPPAPSPPDARTRMQMEEEQDAWYKGFGEPEEDPELAALMIDPEGRRLGPDGRYELEEGFEDPEGEFILGAKGPKDDVGGDDD